MDLNFSGQSNKPIQKLAVFHLGKEPILISLCGGSINCHKIGLNCDLTMTEYFDHDEILDFETYTTIQVDKQMKPYKTYFLAGLFHLSTDTFPHHRLLKVFKFDKIKQQFGFVTTALLNY